MKPVCVAAVACCLFVLFQGVSLAHPDDAPQKNEKKNAVKPGFTISKETTYLLHPVGADGYIDYLQALNELCSKGVTSENNACIPLLRLLGSAQLNGSELPDDFYRRLGIASLPAKGNYLIGWDQFFEQNNDAARMENESLEQRITSRAWSAVEFPKAGAWIKANEKVAVEAIQASHCPRFYAPFVLPKNTKPEERCLMNAVLPSMKRYRDLGTLLRARAMLHLHDNQFDTAIQELIACHRLARLIGQGGSLIGWLWAAPLDRYAANSDLALLADDRITSDTLARFEKEIHGLPAFPSYVELIDKFERLNYLDHLFFVERYGLKHLAKVGGVGDPGWGAEIQDKYFNRGLPWDAALKESNAWYDRYINILNVTGRDKRDQEFKKLQQDIVRIRLQFVTNKNQLTEKWLKPESRASLLADMFRAFYFPGLVTGEVSADLQTQSERNLRVAIALARYRQEQHKYPEKLAELMPKYVATIPQDVFTDKDLVYRRTDQGYLFYSVGINGKDDGGRTRDDKPSGDDIVVRMPLPELKVEGK